MDSLSFFLFTIGMAFSLSSFSFKVALALKSWKASFKFIIAILLLYLGLFLLTTLSLKTFLVFLEPLFRGAFYFHLFMALGLIIWGIYLVWRPHPTSYKSILILLFPCPVCLSAIALSSYLFLKAFPLPPLLGGVILGGIFSSQVLFFYFLYDLFFRNLSQTLSQALLGILMILIGLYLIGSFYFPSKIEELKSAGGPMSFLSLLESFLYLIASSLFIPVLLGLIFLVFWMVYQMGTFLRELVERLSQKNAFLENFKRELIELEKTTSSEFLEIEIENFLQERELKLLKSLDQVRFVIRVGPALGLLGTIIPMGMALAELAKGNLPKMAGSMVTAFTTTVVGLTCGVVAYLISLVKERWIREILKEMHYLAEFILINSFLKKEEKYEEISKKRKSL
ncbi:MAG: DUF2162 family putative transporter [Thermodesulfobacteriaceae bacterium]|nr:DUF2162 family putative transporter [Thermodesulfobacteriaceae bacterium]